MKKSTRKILTQEQKLKQNKATHFLLPILGYSNDFYTSLYINTYIIPGDNPKLICVFENMSKEDLKMNYEGDAFLAQLYRLNNHSSLEDVYYDDEASEIVFVFNIDKVYKEDINKFIKGQYSQFSELLKKQIMKFNERATGKTKYKITIFDALYPSEAKRSEVAERVGVKVSEILEVFDSPDIEHETYRSTKEFINYYKQLTETTI